MRSAAAEAAAAAWTEASRAALGEVMPAAEDCLLAGLPGAVPTALVGDAMPDVNPLLKAPPSWNGSSSGLRCEGWRGCNAQLSIVSNFQSASKTGGKVCDESGWGTKGKVSYRQHHC